MFGLQIHELPDTNILNIVIHKLKHHNFLTTGYLYETDERFKSEQVQQGVS